MTSPLRPLALALLLPSFLGAWSPRFHEAQTAQALQLAPRRLRQYLQGHAGALNQGARGQGSDQVPTVEEVETQYRRIVTLTEQGRQPEPIVHEMGILARQIQLLIDPSAIRGATPLRDAFEAYGDEKRPRLALTQEPFWAAKAPLDPRPALLRWALQKFDRNQTLETCFDPVNNKRIGGWDDLSIPYAQLQLAYSNGVHATVNIWILLWREVGEYWEAQLEDNPSPGR